MYISKWCESEEEKKEGRLEEMKNNEISRYMSLCHISLYQRAAARRL